MEAVELPPVGMSWARAGLPALGPPPLKKGRSRQELMQREAEFQRRRGAAPALELGFALHQLLSLIHI